MRFFVRHYLAMDPRTVVLVRVALALLLLFDLGKRFFVLDVFYVDGGLLPREAIHDWHRDGLSFFWSLGSTEAVTAGFAACALVYVGLLVGFLTKVMQVLAIVCAVSLQTRLHLLTMGGDIVVCLLAWWTVFLPLGRWHSVDAKLLSRWRGRRTGGQARGEPTDDAGGDSGAIVVPESPAGDRPVVSVAVLGLSLQLAVIYFFNAVHKDGTSWMEGTAIHNTLWLDRVVTPLAVWYRGILSEGGSRLLSYGTLAVEGVLPVLILSPFGRPWTRRMAIVLIVGLHTSIALMLNIGIFSAAMIAMATALVSPEDWDVLARWRARRAGKPALPGSLPASAPILPSGAVARGLWLTRELLAAAFLCVIGIAVLLDNRAVPEALRPPAPRWHRRVIEVARLFQGWSMFAPDVGPAEMALVVEAMTERGARVDPIMRISTSTTTGPLIRDVAEQVGQNVFWHHYAQRLPNSPPLYPALEDWLFRFHEYTGNPRDRIMSFKVFVVWRASPPMGGDTRGPPEERLILEAHRSETSG